MGESIIWGTCQKKSLPNVSLLVLTPLVGEDWRNDIPVINIGRSIIEQKRPQQIDARA